VEEAGTLSIEYSGPEIDMLSLGVLETELHAIAEKVAILSLVRDRRSVFSLLDHPGFVTPKTWRIIKGKWPEYAGPFFFEFPFRFDSEEMNANARAIRLRTHDLKRGSIIHEVGLYLAETLTNPDSRAVLQGFGGNLLYAIYQSGLRGIELVRGPNVPDLPAPPTYDPYDVGENLRDIAKELILNNDGEASTVTIKHKIGEGVSEVQIRVR